jgi:hypothetical protein
MKPPLLKFRLGELFGSQNHELTGFFTSLVYDFPAETTWETKQGKRVPKMTLVTFSYTVIHSEAPSLDFARSSDDKDKKFYGINNEIGVV